MGALSIALMYLMEVLRLRMYEAMPPQIEEGKAEVGVKVITQWSDYGQKDSNASSF